jgi:hypothetical protein
MLTTRVVSTSNLIKHYNTHHKDIPTSIAEEQQLKRPEKAEFFKKYNAGIGTGDHIRKLILEVIVSNNLPLSLVESPSFQALIEALNPSIQPISRRTLMQDLTVLFASGRELLILKLAKHIKGGGRLSLTTDTWTSRNYKSFTAVTGHWIDSDWVQNSQLLDLIELTDLVHSGEYLAEKLSEITDSLKITKAVFTITQDNVASNNTMLNEFEAAASFYGDGDCLEQPWSFTRKEGDVRCIGHIINLAVQDALTHLKAVPSDISETYQMDANEARIPVAHT